VPPEVGQGQAGEAHPARTVGIGMRIGLFGGSFDPIHAGHVEPVRAARRALGLDRVFFLPTAHPPHKSGRRFAPPLARFAMAEMALLAEDGLFVSTWELRDEAVYTVVTLEHFTHELTGADLHLLLGSDSLAALATWRRWQELPRLARLVVLARPGWDPAAVRATLLPELQHAWDIGRILAVEHPPVDVSATAIRAQLAAGETPRAGCVHPRVLDYARKYRLYEDLPHEDQTAAG
jgi:nicotinate-nucleotide adenylyltransferase